jgi:type IV pilus assembly protein PilM
MDTDTQTTGLLLRAFPVPTYLAMPALGIDISDYAIKYVSLGYKKGTATLRSHGKVDLPLDTIERGEIKDPATISKLLKRIHDEHRTPYVHLALPEEHAYLFQMEVPLDSKEEVENQLEFHLKENVPIGAEEAVFDYNVLYSDDEGHVLDVSVYPMAIASQYVGVLEEAGYIPLSVEIEGQATARALLSSTSEAPTLIIDMGRNDASISISTGGVVTFTANLETGGDYFSRAIARHLDISFQEAEKLKREHGFSQSKEGMGVYEALIPAMNDFSAAVEKHIMYWQMHPTIERVEHKPIERILLVGGSANIRGVVEYLEAVLELPVDVGNVWQNVPLGDGIPPLHAKESLEYTTAIGLALRGIQSVLK